MDQRTSAKWILLLLGAVWLMCGASAAAQTFCAPPSPPPQKEPPGSPSPACDLGKCRCLASPCYISSGIYTTDETDLQIRTVAFPLVMSRHYRSDRVVDGPLGVGWMSSLTARVYYVATMYSAPSTYLYRAIVTLPSGGEIDFTQNGDGSFTAPSTVRHTLVHNADNTWTFTPEHSRSSYRFNVDGTISSMVDEFGNSLVYTYDANGKLQQVTDGAGSGRFIKPTWEAGRISLVEDSYTPPRRIKYYYDTGTGELTGVADAAVSSDDTKRSTKYGYVTGRFGPLLSTIRDQWDRLISQIAWYPNDQLQSYTEGAYNDSNPSASEGERYRYYYYANGIPPTFQPFTQKVDSRFILDHKYNAQGLISDRTTYDGATGQPTRIVNEWSYSTEFTYNARGNVATRTVRRIDNTVYVSWTYTYDATYRDQIASMSAGNPDWPSWRYVYVPAGQPGAGDVQTIYRGRRNDPGEDVVATYTYFGNGQVKTSNVTGDDNYVYDYYPTGDLKQVTDGSGVTAYVYDSVGRVTAVTARGNRTTMYAYDARDRLVSVTLPKPSPSSLLNFTTAFSYDNYDATSGSVFAIMTDPNGRTTRAGTDAIGNLRSTIDSAGNATTYSYQYNLLQSIRDANGNVTSFTYDAYRHLASTAYPDGKMEQYTRAIDGGLGALTDRKGVTSNFTYDPLGRLTSGPGVYRTYAGSMLTQDGEYLYTYDNAYRVLIEERPLSYKITYAYDQLGFASAPRSYTVDPPAGVTEPSQTVTYNYGASNRITTITWSHIPGVFGISYNPDGTYDTVTFPNSQTRQYTYDGQGRLTAVTNSGPAGLIGKYEYGYDFDWSTTTNMMLGRRTSMTVTAPPPTHQEVGVTKYFYDATYELTKVQYAGGDFEDFQYDAIGNRTSYHTPLVTQAYTYYRYPSNPSGNSSRLKSVAGSSDIAYDDNGNALTAGGAALQWDSLNRIISYAGSTTFTYDVPGRRLTRTEGANTTKFIYRDFDLVAERNAAAGIRNDYLFGPGIDEPFAKRDAAGNVTYFAVDGLGSIIAASNSNGTVIADHAYAAFGASRSGVGSEMFNYTGRELGPPGLFYRARYYDPSLGRFVSEDPLAHSGARVDAASLWPYPYSQNNPVQFVDPFGLKALSCDDLKRVVDDNNQCSVFSSTPTLLCIALTESSGDPARRAEDKRSTAIGLMQINVGTAAWMKCDYNKLFNAAEAVRCATTYLCFLHQRYSKNTFSDIGMYHTGPGTHGTGPEADAYKNKVNNCGLCIVNGGCCDDCNPNNQKK